MTATTPKRPGRPYDGGPTPARSVRIGDVWDQAKSKAEATGDTITAVVERKLIEYLAEETPVNDLCGFLADRLDYEALHNLHDPECTTAGRRILNICSAELLERGGGALQGRVDCTAWDVLIALAQPYNGHVDFRAEWRS